MSEIDDSVAKPQNERLTAVLSVARGCYEEIKLADLRSDQAAQEFVAAVAMLVREARREPDWFNAECKAAEIKRGSKRIEVCATRLAANDPHLAKPRWASAAAYLADHPEDGPTQPAAVEVIQRTPNGIRGLADLHAARTTEKPAATDLTEWADAQLDGIAPDAIVDDLAALNGDHRSYRLVLEKQMPDGSSRVWQLFESDGFGDAAIRRAVKKVKSRVILENGPGEYLDTSFRARADRVERLASARLMNPTGPGLPDSVEDDEEEDEPGEAATSNSDGAENGGVEESVTAESQLQHAVVLGEPKSIEHDEQPPKAVSDPVRPNQESIVVRSSNSARSWQVGSLRQKRFECAINGCQHHKLCQKQSRCIEQPVIGRALVALGGD